MKTHRFDTISFLAGLVITGIGLLFLLPSQPGDIFDFLGEIGSWFWPVFFVAIGTVVLAPLLLRRSQGSDNTSD